MVSRNFTQLEPKKTLANAIQIGNPVSVNKAINILKMFDGIVEQASEQELSDAAAQVDKTGTFNCPHTGVALAVLLKLNEKKLFKPKDRIVIISTAHGLKFVEFKIGYHKNELKDLSSKYANTPIELQANYSEVKDVIFRNIGN